MNPLIMPALQLFADIFKKRRLLRDAVLPLVGSAETMSLGNAERRTFVVKILMGRGVPEGDARLLTEAAVKMWRRLESKRAKKLARLAKKEAREG